MRVQSPGCFIKKTGLDNNDTSVAGSVRNALLTAQPEPHRPRAGTRTGAAGQRVLKCRSGMMATSIICTGGPSQRRSFLMETVLSVVTSLVWRQTCSLR